MDGVASELLGWETAAQAFRAGVPISAAEIACRYIAYHVRRAGGPRGLQGPTRPARRSEGAPPAVRLFAEMRLNRVPEAVGRALVSWSRGEREVDLLFHVPTARDVLALQARGRRCVSLLEDAAQAAPHADGLAFAIHDLCHLEKFVAPEHYIAQVGFFSLVHRAFEEARFRELEEPFDEVWAADRDHVIADMNGSAVFLLLALKSKLLMAVRRRLARSRVGVPQSFGPLRPDEQRAYDDALSRLLFLLEMAGPVGEAARALGARGRAPEAEVLLYEHFHAAGRAVLAG